LAATQAALGRFYHNSKRWSEAETQYRQSLESRHALLSAKPTDSDLQYHVADSHFFLGGLYYATGRLEQAIEQFRAARTIHMKLHRTDAARTAFIVGLGRSSAHLGNALRDRGDVEDSLQYFEQAIGLLASATEKGHNRAAAYLAVAYVERSESFARLERHAESEQDWRLAFQMDLARMWRSQLERAEKLAQAGQHALAAHKAGRLTNEKPSQNKSVQALRFYSLARIYAIGVSAAQHDQRLDEGDREKLSASYAEQAIEHLNRAREAGHFAGPANRQQLNENPEFDPLRSLEAFQQLQRHW
jgi:tetratricopeptide (TPR) repeat protein